MLGYRVQHVGRMVSLKNHLLIAPVHNFTKFLPSACTGTLLYHGQSKSPSKTVMHKNRSLGEDGLTKTVDAMAGVHAYCEFVIT
jgi:hypothetical protein